MALTDEEVRERFWGSVAEQRMELPWCDGCDSPFFYPRPQCPRCWRDVERWEPVSGRGTVWSFSVVRYPLQRGGWEEKLPYAVALVELEEGPRVLADVSGCDPDEVVIGMQVELSYTERDGEVLYQFRPAAGG